MRRPYFVVPSRKLGATKSQRYDCIINSTDINFLAKYLIIIYLKKLNSYANMGAN